MCFVFIWQFLLPIAFVDASESNFFFSLSVLATTNVWEADFRKLLMGLCHQTGIWMVLASVKNEYIKRENAHLNEWQIVNAQSHSTDTGTSTHQSIENDSGVIRFFFQLHYIAPNVGWLILFPFKNTFFFYVESNYEGFPNVCVSVCVHVHIRLV